MAKTLPTAIRRKITHKKMSTNIDSESVSGCEKDVTKRLRHLIDEALDRYTQFDAGCPSRLAEAIRYMLLAPGKRIRPLLTLFAAHACGGDFEDALPAACSVEMIHCYTLIHDDLPSMDNDDLRRGQATCHKRFDEATAILAGDALQTLAFEVLASEVKSRPADCVAALAKACGANSLVGGQADDLAGPPKVPTLEHLEFVHQRKTAALLCVSLDLGGIIANAEPSQAKSLRQYGENLGLAFQIVDDLLDFCGDETKMGKQSGKDQQNGTMTFPAFLGVDESRRRVQKLTEVAIEALNDFDTRANQLRQIARFVADREF